MDGGGSLFPHCIHVTIIMSTVDQEIFRLKIIRVKNFRVVKFSRFRSIRKIFLTVDYIAIWTSTWRVPGVWSTTRYQESQGSLAVVVNRTFTS